MYFLPFDSTGAVSPGFLDEPSNQTSQPIFFSVSGCEDEGDTVDPRDVTIQQRVGGAKFGDGDRKKPTPKEIRYGLGIPPVQ